MPYPIETAEIPCSLDLTEKRHIIRRLRDIINMGSMPILPIKPLINNESYAGNKQIKEDRDKIIYEKINELYEQAEEAGWARDLLDEMLAQACNYGTIYEQHLERPIRERGDYWKIDWMKKLSKTYNDKDWAIFKQKGAWAG